MLKKQFTEEETELLICAVSRHFLHLFPCYNLFMIYSDLSPLWNERVLCHCHEQWGLPPKSPVLDSFVDVIAPECFFSFFLNLLISPGDITEVCDSHRPEFSVFKPKTRPPIISGSDWDNLLMSWCLEWLLILSSTLEHGNFLYSQLLISYYSPIIITVVY